MILTIKRIFRLCLLLASWAPFTMVSAYNAIFGHPFPRHALPIPPHEPLNALKPQNYPPMMTLKDAILLALRSDPNIRNAELTRVTDKFALAVAHNAFEPQYSFDATATAENGSSPQYEVNPKVTWESPMGTNYTINYEQQYGATQGRDMTLTVEQELIRGLGSNYAQISLFNAIDAEKTARLNYKNAVMGEIINVINDYRKVVEDENSLRIARKSLQQSLQTLRDDELRLKTGRIAPQDLISDKQQVASQQLSLLQRQNAALNDMQTLLNTLGLDPSASIRVVPGIQVAQVKLPDKEEAIKTALENNISYQTELIALKVDERSLANAKNQQLWQLDLTATTPLTTTTPGAGDKSVELNLNIPIDNMSLKQTLVNAQIALEQEKITLANQKNTVIRDIENALTDLKLQQDQIGLDKQNVHYAEMAYQAALLKYKSGIISNFEVTQRQNTLTDAQNSLVSDQISFLNSLDSFYQTLGTALDKWGIELKY